jgi:hypothetical protein
MSSKSVYAFIFFLAFFTFTFIFYRAQSRAISPRSVSSIVQYSNTDNTINTSNTISDKINNKTNQTGFGSFSWKNFRPDFTLDTSGTLPFISGANLVLFADHVYDIHVRKIEEVKSGDVVYVKTDVIDEFFIKIYPKIRNKFVLITHNSDHPTDKEHKRYLDREKILAWFGQNPGFEHSKHFPIPIGMENPIHNPRKLDFIRSVNDSQLIPWEKRKYLLYINFNQGTNPNARNSLIERFRNSPGVLISEQRVDYETYMNTIGDSKFVLCPRGNGLDTHRYYETILMGSIPVVENSTLFKIFRESETLVLTNLSSLTIESLKNHSQNVKSETFSKKIIMWETWRDRIEMARLQANNSE